MASKQGRSLNNWRTPEGRLLKAVLHALVKQQHDKRFVVGEFKRLIPDYQAFHRHPVTDLAIWGRADIGVRPGYEREHPDKDVKTAVFLPRAAEIVALGEPISVDDVKAYIALVQSGDYGPAEPTPADDAARLPSAGPEKPAKAEGKSKPVRRRSAVSRIVRRARSAKPQAREAEPTLSAAE